MLTEYEMTPPRETKKKNKKLYRCEHCMAFYENKKRALNCGYKITEYNVQLTKVCVRYATANEVR